MSGRISTTCQQLPSPSPSVATPTLPQSHSPDDLLSSSSVLEITGLNNFPLMEAPTSSSSRLGVRKRVDSFSDDGSFLSVSYSKKPRLSAMAMPPTLGDAGSIGIGADRLPRPVSIFDSNSSFTSSNMSASFYFSPRRHARPMSGTSNASMTSRSGSPFYSDLSSYCPERQLMRSISSSSLHSLSTVQTYPENSAKHNLRHTRTTIDYSLPEVKEGAISARLLSCTANNVALFTRGNRIHCKNINANHNTDIVQLCKLADSQGHIRAIESAGKSHPDLIAVGTSLGYIQLWDVSAKKMTAAWGTTKDISALAWNGAILTVGGARGTIRHYDTRLPSAKMKEQTRKVTRHQGQITCLQWNENGKFLASADATGTVFCWELGQRVPLDVGEFFSRRKKIQHDGKVTALSWAPWQTKLLATGDDKGILRLWNISEKDRGSNALNPGKLYTGAAITGIHFSPHCKEILTTHGAPVDDLSASTSSQPSSSSLSQSQLKTAPNSIQVHSSSSLRHVATYNPPKDAEGAISDSVLDSTGLKVIYSTPAHGKIDVCDVWAKQKELKKRQSFCDNTKSFIR